MRDLISRNDAIEAIAFGKVYMTTYLGYVNEGNPLKQYNKGLDDAIKAINKLPSAEPERKWIPVTEALPKDNADVLVQFKSNMGVGYYEDDGWSIATGEDLYSGVDESEDKPIAWMPLPEPWRGDR